jgi:hypothetical protein
MRLAFVPWLLLSFCLTGCPLSDHYSLLPDATGGADSGTDGGGSASASSESAGVGGFGGLSGNGPTLAGSGNGGAASGGNSGNPGAGSEAAGNGGSSEAGAPDLAGSGGQGPIGGSAGLDGMGGTSGSSGSSGDTGTSGAGGAGPTCSASSCNLSCCGSSCVDLTRDFQNCGACGTVCNAPRTCMSSACASGWVSMSPPPLTLGFAARWRAASVAMGKSVFIWGGSDSSGAVLDSGAIYNPMDDSWVAVTKDANTLTARIFATAVWTGSVVVVFGGSDATGATPYKDAAFYDPAQKAWSPLPVASKARSSALGFWDGTRALFWGGIGSTAAAVAGADRFDPILAASTVSNITGDPGAILSPASGWDGSTLYLQGGQVAGARTDKVSSYNSNSDTWSVLSKSLSARSNAFGVWDGARFVVWGGRDDFNNLHNDGKYQSGVNWYTMATMGQPSVRMAVPRRQGWVFETSPGLIALFGGQTSLAGSGTFTNTGATYDVVNSKWGTAASWPSAETHDYGVGVWTGEEFVLWGGRNGAGATPASTLTGERWTP